MCNENNNCFYVVFGSNFEDNFTTTYFKTKAQAENYKKYREKIKSSPKEEYYVEKFIFEDENVDYSKIKLLSTIKFQFNNFCDSSLDLKENIKERQIRYFPDTEEKELHKKPSVEVIVIDYEKPTLGVMYKVCIKDVKDNAEIEKLLQKFNVLNKKILEEATTLCNAALSENITDEEDNGFYISCTLTDKFKKEMEMFING